MTDTHTNKRRRAKAAPPRSSTCSACGALARLIAGDGRCTECWVKAEMPKTKAST